MSQLPGGSCSKRRGSPELKTDKAHIKSMIAEARTQVGLPSFVVQSKPSEIVMRGFESNTLGVALTFLWDQKYTLFSVFIRSKRA